MKTEAGVPFVDTTIIPDRNAGIGSLLWDLQNPADPGRDGPPLLGPEFAFIDVGASRAGTSIALKMLLARDLGMAVDYVATELPGAVPAGNVTPLGDRAERIRGYLSTMISSNETRREVTDWHYVVDHAGKVASVAYSYRHHGNEVWEAYYMGRPFMVSGQPVAFRDPALDELLAPDAAAIEARVDRERNRDGGTRRPEPSWDGYRIVRNSLEAGLAEFGITLQETDVPRRIRDRQNVLFLGNVLNHYPHDAQARELDRIAANMRDGDLVIVQVDEAETASVDVLRVKGPGARTTRERVRWINTRTLEVQRPGPAPGSWRQVCLKPELEGLTNRLMDGLRRTANSPEWRRDDHQVLARRHLSQVFWAFFRALPAEKTLRVAIREALRRLPSGDALKGIPVFEDDATDVHGGALGSDPRPIVPGAEPPPMKGWESQ